VGGALAKIRARGGESGRPSIQHAALARAALLSPLLSMHDALRTLLTGAIVYITVTIVLRVTGKRSLSTYHALDFVVVVALGSSIATAVMMTSLSWSSRAVAVGIPIALQAGVAFISSRSRKFEHFVTAKPAMLVENGQYLHEMMLHETMTEDEVNHAVRTEGIGSLADVAAVILEKNGELTVIPRANLGDGSMLRNIRRVPKE
jgi:uncharacterized membrane protein YcaP (DUF421 family)